MYTVFVYGTLKTGEPNHYLMEDETEGVCKYKGLAKTVHKYPMVIATGYNLVFVLGAEGKGHHVIGEVYEIDDVKLSRLDKQERHPELYEREEIQVEITDDGGERTVINAFTYILNKFQPHLLDLPMIENYTDKINKNFVMPKDRDNGPTSVLNWWYEVHTGYTKPV